MVMRVSTSYTRNGGRTTVYGGSGAYREPDNRGGKAKGKGRFKTKSKLKYGDKNYERPNT